MKPKGVFLSWIVVEDIEKAIAFYTKTLGFTLHEYHKEFKWAELSGPAGCRIGIAEYCQENGPKAGSNAVMTISVDDIGHAISDLKKAGARLDGDLIEIPGHVKMQTLFDIDGNMLQLVQML